MINKCVQIFTICLALAICNAQTSHREGRTFDECILVTGNPQLCLDYYYLYSLRQNNGHKGFSNLVQETLTDRMMNRLVQSRKRPLDFSDVPAPLIQTPFRSSIIDPRTSASNLLEPDQQVASLNNFHSSSNSLFSRNNHPSAGMRYPILRPMIDPRTVPFDLTNSPAPQIENAFSSSIVDPRTLMLNQPQQEHQPLSRNSIDFPLNTPVNMDPPFGLKYPIMQSMIDPRTLPLELTNARTPQIPPSPTDGTTTSVLNPPNKGQLVSSRNNVDVPINSPETEMKYPILQSMIDSRTIPGDLPATIGNQPLPSEIDLQTSVSNKARSIEQGSSKNSVDVKFTQSTTGNQDGSIGIEHPFQQSMIDQKTSLKDHTIHSPDIWNELSPEVQYLLQPSVVDPRAFLKLVEEARPTVTVPVRPQNIDFKHSSNFIFSRPPVIRYQYKLSEQLWDPRTMQPSTKILPYPIVPY